MAKQTIALGTSPTGVGGDTPRSAFTKAQANFDELYANFVNMGLGNVPPVLANPALNFVDYFGYFYVNSATNAPPSPHTSGYLMVQPINTLYCAQTFTSTVDGSVWTRSRLNGTWSVWGKNVTNTSILGTVSISGGYPAGSLFQNGSNSNGLYVRFTDGTQICTTNSAQLVPPTGISSILWTYPIAFVAPPNFVSLTASVGAGSDVRNYLGQATYNNILASSCLFTTYMAGAVGCFAYAIGRWF